MNKLQNTLAHIRIIMIGTTLPANIGSAARAMHTMGLTDLVIVNPKLPIDDTSYANAAGGSHLLEHTQIVTTLLEALAPCGLILAASARSRHLPHPVITPNHSGVLIETFLQAQQAQKLTNPPKVALLFGREDRGLTNDELSCADYHIQIPANPAYPVLNVASAIQVIAASIYAHLNQQTLQPNVSHELDIITRTHWDEPAINFAQKNALQNQLTQLLIKLNLAREDDLKDLPKRLSRLSSRLQLDQKEYALLQALIAKITQKL